MHGGATLKIFGAALSASLCLGVVGPAFPADVLSVTVRDKSLKSPIPPKSPKGQSDSVSVVSEGVGETEFRTADEIASAVASGQEGGPNGETGLRVVALSGKGGIQNIKDVLTRPDVDFGIAPTLVLEKVAETSAFANLRRRMAYVAPLYVEEVHLLATPEIRGVSDLQGANVSVGEDGGSNEFLARLVLEGLGISVVAENLDTKSAIVALRERRIAAAFVISGKPVDPLLGIPERDGIHPLPLPLDKVPEGFLPSTLSNQDYPSLVPPGKPVQTYGAQNVLFGYDWPVRSARGKVGQQFLSILMYRLPDLQVGSRHPKWREVNVASVIPGWKRLPAMQAWLDAAQPRASGPIGSTEFDTFLRRNGTKVTGENRDALFQDFLRWRNTPVVGASR